MQSTTDMPRATLMVRAIACMLAMTLVAGCEFGVEPSSQISPNYDLLGACPESDNAFVARMVSAAMCGTIKVYEDRAAQSGRQIDLNVMLLPATSSQVKPDPIFLLAGGPGQSAVDAGPMLFARLPALRKERDVVLVDQRGTGQSNSLACELEGPVFEQLSLTVEESLSLQLERLNECLEAYDADPALYTTPIAMDDLDEVREQLGYPEVNLIGISYGTRAAQVFLRRHEAVTRTVILDAVVPMDLPIPGNIAIDAQAAFDSLIADCHSQPACAEAFPDLGEHFRAVVSRLENNPEPVDVVHPRTGEPMSGPLDHRVVNRLVRNVMYDRNLSQLLPLAIEEAYRGNFQVLATLAYTFADVDGMSLGMMLSVLCSEDMTLIDQHDIGQSQDFDNPILELLQPACRTWPRGEIPENYFTPVKSDKPVLVTSGLLDPVTPPRYGFDVMEHLSNAEHIIVPGVGHGTIMHGCMPDLVAKFIETSDPAAVKAGCEADLQRPPFFTSFAGPSSYPAENSDD